MSAGTTSRPGALGSGACVGLGPASSGEAMGRGGVAAGDDGARAERASAGSLKRPVRPAGDAAAFSLGSAEARPAGLAGAVAAGRHLSDRWSSAGVMVTALG